jgi:hypothetical protein
MEQEVSRTKRVNIRMTDREWSDIVNYASELGVSASDFMRMAHAEKGKRMRGEQQHG